MMVKFTSHSLVYIIVILFIIINVVQLSLGFNMIGMHDKKLCLDKNKTFSCQHQIDDLKNGLCKMKYINSSYCEPIKILYDIEEIYDPEKSPCHISLYKFKHNIHQQIAFNLTFLTSKWKTMEFALRNLHLNKHVCRKFILDYNTHLSNASLQEQTIFFDCLLFNPNIVEKNFFSLYLVDNMHQGESYTFTVPYLKNFDIESTNVSSWHVFMYLHDYYMESTNKLAVTIQSAPFEDVSYLISLVRCLSNDLYCQHHVAVKSLLVLSNRTGINKAHFTSILRRETTPGTYAVAVQLQSQSCGPTGCAISLSPTYTIKRTYKVEIVCGMLLTLFVVCLCTYYSIRKIHQNFKKYLESKESNPESLLLIYHAYDESYAVFLHHFMNILQDSVKVEPLLVDKHIEDKNPDDWTRFHMSQSSRVIFLVPKTLEGESVLPIQHQWLVAIKNFSLSLLRQKNSSKYCNVYLPNSMTIPKGHQIKNLQSFNLPKDIGKLVNWLHRNSVIDSVVSWRNVIKEIKRDLQIPIDYVCDPSRHTKPLPYFNPLSMSSKSPEKDSKLNLLNGRPPISEANFHFSSASAEEVDDSSECSDFESHYEKVRQGFDPAIIDVRQLSTESLDTNTMVEGDSKNMEKVSIDNNSSSDTDEDSDPDELDVLNFID